MGGVLLPSFAFDAACGCLLSGHSWRISGEWWMSFDPPSSSSSSSNPFSRLFHHHKPKHASSLRYISTSKQNQNPVSDNPFHRPPSAASGYASSYAASEATFRTGNSASTNP